MSNQQRSVYAVFVFALIIGCAGMAGLVFSNNQTITAQGPVPENPSSTDMGKTVYQQYCLACHAVDGRGNNGAYPDLVSEHFKKTKGTLEKTYNFISQKMPQNAPGSLSEEQYSAVAKYVLSVNGIPADFSDVAEHWARQEINFLLDKNYIDGYVSQGQLHFKPQQNITRAEFIRYLVKAKQLFLSDTSTTDLTDIGNSKDQVYIITAVEYGVINGYPGHTFHPAKGITRAEIAAVLARSESLTATAVSSFSDVSPNHWAKSLIDAVVQAKFFNGYSDSTFKPDAPFTRGEAAAVIYRLIHPN